jgi:hypothetical protein
MPKEDCIQCEKEFEMHAKGSIFGEIYKGMNKDFAMHSHIILCPKCSKAVIAFLKNALGKNKNKI